jgi:hypothetical protein
MIDEGPTSLNPPTAGRSPTAKFAVVLAACAILFLGVMAVAAIAQTEHYAWTNAPTGHPTARGDCRWTMSMMVWRSEARRARSTMDATPTQAPRASAPSEPGHLGSVAFSL